MQRLMIILFLLFLTACSLAPVKATTPMQAVTSAATVEVISPTSTIENTIAPTKTATPTATKPSPTETPQPTTPPNLVLLDGETVQWWNKNTRQYETLEHIKTSEILHQGDWLTGLVTGVPAEAATGNEPRYPIAVVNLATGELARGDFKNTASKQIHYNRAVKMDDGVWYLWETESQTWNPVIDETMQVILELGEDPNDEYEEQKWADGTYLVKKYNGARLAVRRDAGWEPITDLTVRYGKYLGSIRSIDEVLVEPFRRATWTRNGTDVEYYTTLGRFRGVYVDHDEALIWYRPSLGQYITLYTTTKLVPVSADSWQLVRSIWGNNDLFWTTGYPQPHINLGEQIRGPGGGISGKRITEDLGRALRVLRPGQVLDSNVETSMEIIKLDDFRVMTQELINTCKEDSETLFSLLPETAAAVSGAELPPGLIVYSYAESIPLGFKLP